MISEITTEYAMNLLVKRLATLNEFNKFVNKNVSNFESVELLVKSSSIMTRGRSNICVHHTFKAILKIARVFRKFDEFDQVINTLKNFVDLIVDLATNDKFWDDSFPTFLEVFMGHCKKFNIIEGSLKRCQSLCGQIIIVVDQINAVKLRKAESDVIEMSLTDFLSDSIEESDFMNPSFDGKDLDSEFVKLHF